ncbi:MAG: GNAT family N-acetyltransferase [Duncaniella sp.]|nr:GNAT family N-acetyltransferase [Muribaculum sp.]MCM1255746.1 GNAT family N-acetyltransferase [Duncaniella sp.]
MSKRDDIKRIWQESFSDTREYVRMYFEQVYRDDEALLLNDEEGTPVSSLLLQHYTMTFHGETPDVSYIAGAATRRSQRGKGYMSQLISMALQESVSRGDMLCALIPGNEALYYFYQRYGFTTVFYMKEQRFTALHPFNVEKPYHALKDVSDPKVWEAFDRMQKERECYILHSERDFYNILSDLKVSGGDFVVMTHSYDDAETDSNGQQTEMPRIASMAWAEKRDDLLVITDVMGDTRDSRMAALRQLRGIHGDTPFLLYGVPTDKMGGRLMPRGMCRVVNVEKALSIIAESHPDFGCKIRVTDPILSDVNSHTFHIKSGRCEIIDEVKPEKLDFDVDIRVFTDILFSAPETGELIHFPSVRPMISLMLD